MIIFKILLGNVFEGFLTRFLNYIYLRHLESYYCILRWILCIKGSFKKNIYIFYFFLVYSAGLPVGGGPPTHRGQNPEKIWSTIRPIGWKAVVEFECCT
jgi:hypothetical protein